MDHIPKTYRDRRQEHSHTKRKQYDHRKRDHRQKYRPVQLRSRRYHHKQQRRKGCHQIDKTGHHPGKHEQVLRHIHFLDQRSAADDRRHRTGRRIIEKVKDHLTAQYIQRKIFHIKFKNTGKYDGKNDHHAERI